MDQDEWTQLRKRRERLHPDLEGCLMESPRGIGLNRPLVQELSVDPDHAAQLNWRYQEKCALVADAYDKRDWSSYIRLHERPYRLQTFAEIADELPDKKYWLLLSDVWIDSNNIWQNQTLWRELWNEDRPGKHHAMDAKERKAFELLPAEITAYRGIREGHTVTGMSWTLDRDKAIWFATRHSIRNGDQPILLTGRVMKSDTHAVLLGRKEHEIVVEKCEVIASEHLAPMRFD